MINIEINNPELEQSIKQTFGDDVQSLSRAFVEFLKQQKIKQDIEVSIRQIEQGDLISLQDAVQEIQSKYE